MDETLLVNGIDPAAVKVGDRLWFVSGQTGGGYRVAVTKVGRLWIHLSNRERAGRSDLHISSPYGGLPELYASKEFWLKEVELQERWLDVRSRINAIRRHPGENIVTSIERALEGQSC